MDEIFENVKNNAIFGKCNDGLMESLNGVVMDSFNQDCGLDRSVYIPFTTVCIHTMYTNHQNKLKFENYDFKEEDIICLLYLSTFFL